VDLVEDDESPLVGIEVALRIGQPCEVRRPFEIQVDRVLASFFGDFEREGGFFHLP